MSWVGDPGPKGHTEPAEKAPERQIGRDLDVYLSELNSRIYSLELKFEIVQEFMVKHANDHVKDMDEFKKIVDDTRNMIFKELMNNEVLHTSSSEEGSK